MADRDDELDKWAKHERRIADMEPWVESFKYHHRNDRVVERLNEISERARQALATAERVEGQLAEVSKRMTEMKRSNGGGNGQVKDTETRLRWVERILWGALGAVAMFELMARL